MEEDFPALPGAPGGGQDNSLMTGGAGAPGITHTHMYIHVNVCVCVCVCILYKRYKRRIIIWGHDDRTGAACVREVPRECAPWLYT
jgi:hypothetical protein